MERRVRLSLLLLSVSLLLFLLSPYLLSYGMFFDGITYSAISRNLAIGFGSPWKPAYSLTLGREFYGHPPMGFWLQSIIYLLFGEGLYLDKAYTFSVAALNLVLFYVLYRLLRRKGDTGFWAPLMLLISFHSYRWVVRNNLLENTMTTFVLLATVFYTLSLRRGVLHSVPAGLSVLAAFLVKGPVGTFPLLSPLLLPVDADGRRRLLAFSLGFGVALLSFTLLLTLPDVRNFFSHYLHGQIAMSIAGRENPAPSRLYILYALGTELLFPTLILLPLWVLFRRLEWDGRTLRSLLIALSGSLPIMLSLKQARFYLHPSLFFYALFLTFLFRPSLRALEENPRTVRLALPLSVILFAMTLPVSLHFAGTGMGGYRPFYRDFVENPLDLHLHRHEYLSVCPKSLYRNWSMFAGMERAFKLSMTSSGGSRYLLVDRTACGEIPGGYVPIHVGKRFVLYGKGRP